MLTQFSDHIETHLSYLQGQRLLIAISGGLDSVVLTHLCETIGLNFALAHCNFNLRGNESQGDEDFVLDLADQLDKEIFIQHFDTEDYAKKHQISLQMAARELRYNWFYELAEQLGFDYILTAHHANDNLETFLINLSRGSGLNGLLGIPERNDKVVRPLLPFSRDALLDYANTQNYKWREDSSNTSNKYLRNKIRLEVIPKLLEIEPYFLENFRNTLDHLSEIKVIVDKRTGDLVKAAVTEKEGAFYISIKELQAQGSLKAYLYQILHPYGFTAWEDIVGLLDAQSGKRILSPNWELLKDRDHLILSQRFSPVSETITIDKNEEKVVTPIGEFHLNEVASVENPQSKCIFVDASKLKFPLTVRPWREGDRFVPFGMTGSKKLSKYLKDEKVSLLEKEKVLLLCSEEDIVWVIGKRMDDRYKVTSQTRTILKIALH